MMLSVRCRTTALLMFLVLVPGFARIASGHALQPGYLELRLLKPGVYGVVWKTPANKSKPMAITAELPESCDPRTPGQPVWDGSAYVTRWTADCPGGLEGGVIRIDGLEKTSTVC